MSVPPIHQCVLFVVATEKTLLLIILNVYYACKCVGFPRHLLLDLVASPQEADTYLSKVKHCSVAASNDPIWVLDLFFP